MHESDQLRFSPEISNEGLIARSRKQHRISFVADSEPQHFADRCNSTCKQQVLRIKRFERVEMAVEMLDHSIPQTRTAPGSSPVGHIWGIEVEVLICEVGSFGMHEEIVGSADIDEAGGVGVGMVGVAPY